MFRLLFLMVVCTIVTLQVKAQKWDDLSDEQKMNELQAFRDENQAYLKNTLKLTQDQMDDLDNTNLCFLSTLDRIDRYGKSDADKTKYGKKAFAARSAMVEAIMGPEKRKQYMAYIDEKLEKYMQ